MTWTADDLLSAVRVRGQFPDANGAITSAELLALADEAMLEDIEPVLFVPGSEHGLQTYEATIVAGTAAYRLPKRAVLGKLRDLWYVDASGNERRLDEVTPESAPRPAGQTGSDPRHYYMRGEHVVLLDVPSAAGGRLLRMRYYLRRPRLVLVAAAPRITGIAGLVVSAVVPAGWAFATDRFDFVRYGGLFDHLGTDLAATALTAGVSITMTAALPADLAIGDYISLAGESSLLCIPIELHPALTSLTLARALRAVGDPAWEKEEVFGRAKLNGFKPMIKPRNDGSQAPIVNMNSPLRSGVWR